MEIGVLQLRELVHELAVPRNLTGQPLPPYGDRLEVASQVTQPSHPGLADEAGEYDGYVAIGVVIRGETYHFEIVAGESARGIMALTMDGMAVGNGILTVENEAQAIVRADPKQKDKGGEAAKAAIALLGLKEKFGG